MIRFPGRTREGALAAAALAALALGWPTSALSQSAPPPPSSGERSPADWPEPPAAVPVSGTVASYNYNPHGSADSLNVKDEGGKPMQLNFPPDVSGVIIAAASVGDHISGTAIPTRSMPDHPVYLLVTLTGGKSQQVQIPQPGSEKEIHVDGVVKSLNYNREGLVDGAILESGELLHTGPAAEKLKLTVGAKLSVDGKKLTTPGGLSVIHATNVNGTKMGPPMRNSDRRGHGPGADRGPGGDRGPGADRGPRPDLDGPGGPDGPRGADGPGNPPGPGGPPDAGPRGAADEQPPSAQRPGGGPPPQDPPTAQ